MRRGLSFLQVAFLTALAPVASATGAFAQETSCIAEVNNQRLIIVPGLVETDPPSWRERLSFTKTEEIDGYPVCKPQIVIGFLGAMDGMEDTSSYCLTRSSDTQTWLLAPGARNRQGECKKTVCDRVNVAREESEEIFQKTTGLLTGREVNSNAEGVVAVAQSTGALVLTGQAAGVMQALGTGASMVGGLLASPAVAAVGAVTVMSVGGAVYLCKE